MTSWTDIPDSDLDPEQPITSTLAVAWRNNPIALAERASGAPWLNGVGASEILTGSGTWTVPAEVYRVRVIRIGAGGGGGSAQGVQDSDGAIVNGNDGADGGDTSFGALSPAVGGAGGYGAGTGQAGKNGAILRGGNHGMGAAGYYGGSPDFSAPNLSNGTDGTAGVMEISVISVTPGSDYTYACGARGAGGSAVATGINDTTGPAGGDAGNGVIILEY